MFHYGDTIDLNTVTDKVGIVGQFLQNAKVNGIQAAQSLDRLARGALFSPYFGGNTRVRVTLGAAGVSVQVDDVRGFLVAPANGTMQAISAGNPLTVTVGANAYTLVGAVADGTLAGAQLVAASTGLTIPTGITFSGTGNNVSTAAQAGGFSGVLTFSGAVSVSDGTAGNTVQAANASVIARPSGRANTSLLQASDTLTMSVLLDGVADLRKNNVPHIDGAYNCYLDPVSARQLFADPDFKQLYQGSTGASQVFRKGMVNDFLGLRFMPTTEAYVAPHPSISGVNVRRPILVGQGALVEGDFAGMGAEDAGNPLAVLNMVDKIVQVTRAPMDRLQQIVAQSWYWIGGFVAPTDITANTTIIPTATNAAYKRAVLIEHVG